MSRLRPSSDLASEAPERFEVGAALRYAVALTPQAPVPGSGRTRELWSLLAVLGERDLQLARAVEPHLDAVGVLTQAGRPDLLAHRSWGVFAAEAPGVVLEARENAGEWVLDGVKPWCSLASRLDAALVTAHIGGARRLFAVDLRQGGVRADDGAAWVARGLVDIPSGPVEFTGVHAVPIGEPGWYLERPGFAWGGIGVAACWFGGAIALAASVRDAVDGSDALLAVHLGAIDSSLHASALALGDAAEAVDAGAATGPDGSLLAKRVRAIVAGTCELVLDHAAHALGPAPLALDAGHAQRVADLSLYVRQHHAERDLASLGTAVARSATPW